MEVSTKKIKIAMACLLMTQAQLAEKSGMTRQTISTTLTRGTCSTITAGKIAAALNLSPAEIIDTEGQG